MLNNSGKEEEERFQVKVAWLYHVEGLIQEEVARHLGVTRLRVNRALSEASQKGIIRVQINSAFSPCFNLESQLKNKYKLKDVSIAPRPANDTNAQAIVGAELGRYLSTLLKKPEIKVFGMAWGTALDYATKAIVPTTREDLEIISVMGCLPEGSDVNGFEIISRISSYYSSKRTYFTTPLYASSEQSRDTIMIQDVYRDILIKIRSADAIAVGLGDATDRSLLIRGGLPKDISVESLVKAGAVGDMLGYFINKNGECIDHPINRRTIGLTPFELKDMKNVILTAGGQHKVPILAAALKMGVVDILISDQNTAERLLAYDS